MATIFEKTCLYEANLAQKHNKKSKAIEILKFRQCRDTCCSKRLTSKRGEELINRGFATTDSNKRSLFSSDKSFLSLELQKGTNFVIKKLDVL